MHYEGIVSKYKTVKDARPLKESWISDQYWTCIEEIDDITFRKRLFYLQRTNNNGEIRIMEEFGDDGMHTVIQTCETLEKAVNYLENSILNHYSLKHIIYHE